ncbi:DUF7693 family protein [Pseudomonas putida]|uniref:DUF7693 family protein n=1 Tax=Pseudomonas putida TaxID=303 RepID=UPI003D9999FB
MPTLTAREVYQTIRDAALGLRPLKRLTVHTESAPAMVDIEGWRLTLDVEGSHLRHCLHGLSPDGRAFDGGQRYGTDPVSLLSTWELAQIERLLGAE